MYNDGHGSSPRSTLMMIGLVEFHDIQTPFNIVMETMINIRGSIEERNT